MIASRDDALLIARALLDEQSGGDLRSLDGLHDAAMVQAFRSGVEIVSPDGEVWNPGADPLVMRPGSANYDAATEALSDGCLRVTGEGIDDLVSRAAKDRTAFAACLIVHGWLLAQGSPVPPGLSEVVSGKSQRQRAHGPNPDVKKARNRRIIAAVYGLTQAGVPLHEGEASPGTYSAYGIVADAVTMMGVSVTYSAVRDIYERHTDKGKRGRRHTKKGRVISPTT